MVTMQIESPDNPLVKRLAKLADGAGRRAEGLFLAEGQRLIDGLLAGGWRPVWLLVRTGESIPPHWPTQVLVEISERVCSKLSQAATASGFLAAFPLPPVPAIDAAAGGLLLAGVADPGNMGTLIRTAAACGIRQVALAEGADPFGPKVVQASAGALALVQLHRGVTPAALAGGAPCCALVVRDGQPPAAFARRPRWLVVGGEAHGISPAWLAACSERLTLPMPGGTESLNAAVAGSIAAYLLCVG